MSAGWNSAPWSGAEAVGSQTMTTDSVPGNQEHSDVSPCGLPSLLIKDPKSSAKRLKPDKWRASFDDDGRPVGFHKLLKGIALGGVDHSIRAEVWEFLLGCYALGTTAEFREQLRAARRQRYRELILQCQKFHPSIGTGNLAYTVGSKVMDVRIMSKDSARKEAKVGVQRAVEVETGRTGCDSIVVQSGSVNDHDNNPQFDSSGDFSSTFDKHIHMGFTSVYKYDRSKADSPGVVDTDTFDYSEELVQLPVRRLFDGSAQETTNSRSIVYNETHDGFCGNHLPGQVDSGPLRDTNTEMKESTYTVRKHNDGSPRGNKLDDLGPLSRSTASFKRITSRFIRDKRTKDRASKIGDATRESIHSVYRPIISQENTKECEISDPVAALAREASEERVAEWLWTLHKIVVDVVRTDRHLVFYGASRNMARMSDILAIYAWIDPGTGYCQGMSDLLSPFIVLFDDDADAFWCFEALMRRVRQNFQMEGPVGVMKQLDALPKILDLTDSQMSKHLCLVGADSFLFAFRMLLVLFRRELSFGEALYMWEMMWAADFKQTVAWALENTCLEALVLRIPARPQPVGVPAKLLGDEVRYVGPTTFFSSTFDDSFGDDSAYDIGSAPTTTSNHFGINLLAKSPFCGLRPGALLTKNRPREATVSSILGKNGDEELSVFCVAAVLVENRSKILKELQSMDDAIKMFNDMQMKIRVHSSIHTAIKLRKKYRSRMAKNALLERQAGFTF